MFNIFENKSLFLLRNHYSFEKEHKQPTKIKNINIFQKHQKIDHFYYEILKVFKILETYKKQ